MAKQQTVMKLRVTAVLPLPDANVEAVVAGAHTNRDLVVAMSKLGYRDVEAHVTVGQARLEEPAKAQG